MTMRALLGIAWGLLVAALGLRMARRATARDQIAIAPRPTRRRRSPSRRARTTGGRRASIGRPVVRLVAAAGGARRQRRVDDALLAELPVAVDLLAVAAGAGATPYVAIGTAAAWAPPAAYAVLAEVQRACDLGADLESALRAGRRRHPPAAALHDALLTSLRLGTPVVPALTRLAAEVRADLRRRGEIAARQVSVRLLFPLVLLVLPAFGLLTIAPALIAGFRRM